MSICDCDEATAAWYLSERGLDQRAATRHDLLAPPLPPPPRAKPASLVLRAPRSTRLAPGAEGAPPPRSLRLSARLAPAAPPVGPPPERLLPSDPNGSSAERLFRLVYCPQDTALAVWEIPVRGILGGVFQKKQPWDGAPPGGLVIGAEIVVKGHRMIITEVV